MTYTNDTQQPITFVIGDREIDLTSDCEATVVNEYVHRRLAECPYAFFMNQVAWRFDEGVLTLTGRVATDRLKHTLESLLRNVKHVKHILNHVDVVSTTGVSSICPR